MHEPRRNAMKEDTGSLLDELKRQYIVHLQQKNGPVEQKNI